MHLILYGSKIARSHTHHRIVLCTVSVSLKGFNTGVGVLSELSDDGFGSLHFCCDYDIILAEL